MKTLLKSLESKSKFKSINNHASIGIDGFRLIFALITVGAHTSPLDIISSDLDYFVFHVCSRVVIPFFLMTTGYFLLPQYFAKNSASVQPLIKFIKKTAGLYAIATAIYLPISIYAGHYSQGSITAVILQRVIFDGTYYHLWYLPASIIGVLIVYYLGRWFTQRTVLLIAIFLYFLGMLGDSYYGLVTQIPVISSLLDAGFKVFNYTRNGLFIAPIFLVLGSFVATTKHQIDKGKTIQGLFISIILMASEGIMVQHFGWQRHDSMYIALLPCVYFMYRLIASHIGRPQPFVRDISKWVYILHPLLIITLRGIGKVTGSMDILVENSITHYVGVCLLSVLLSVVIIGVNQKLRSLETSSQRRVVKYLCPKHSFVTTASPYKSADG
jgi:serine/alanine racemase